MVSVCEKKVERNLSDEEERSPEYFIDCRVGKGANAYFQEGNEMISVKDIINFQERKSELSYF
jgi:hypothetical protein